MNRRALGMCFAAEIVAIAFLATALMDRRMHQADPTVGYNQWGYRDEATSSREPGERRVAIVGGSSAFEAHLRSGYTLAGQVFTELRAAGAPLRQVYSVANLSEPGSGADTYVAVLRDYSYLDPEVVCIFDGYDTLGGMAPHGRRHSFVFRTIGYLPILPSVVAGTRGWLSDEDGGVADILRDDRGETGDVSCAGASRAYCTAMADTVQFALDQGHAVLVVSPPSVSERHAAQQRSLADALARRFAGRPRFLYLDLGRAMPLSDRVLSPDGLHRTLVGNHVLGQRIATALLHWVFAEPPRVNPPDGSR